jgi:hypothetical protein
MTHRQPNPGFPPPALCLAGRDQAQFACPLENLVAGGTVELAVDRLRVRTEARLGDSARLVDLVDIQVSGVFEELSGR